MERTGIADLPLHHGKAPKWLFQRMVKLSRSIVTLMRREYGTSGFLHKISDPYWFNALGCVLGYDWHSSGLTTVTMGALKEALAQTDLGIVVCGGKGRASKKTLEELEKVGLKFNLSQQEVERLKYCSRMVAKVDNALVQDNYQLYHHSFILAENGEWAVIQQGLNSSTRFARRYHWLSTKFRTFVDEPHTAIVGRREKFVIDLTAKRSEEARKCSVDLVRDNPEHLRKYLKGQLLLSEFTNKMKWLKLPKEHRFQLSDLDERVIKNLKLAYELQPEDYEELVSIRGIGSKCIRALALVSNLIYGAELSYEDPCKFSFAHGGKDGIPYPVDRKTYDFSIRFLEDAIRQSELNNFEKLSALKRLSKLLQPPSNS
ncbi:MAG: DUF763 domain-containing protein [Candidatus Nanoarchaeia archaeon]|nr:DUF763 domain-containing protein [Candidatus Haiyanarchaeum thermophilum]MCW1303404.1 DUF763 domain-containing protein [Candidatus Haiyanarchaeum thermophilum]MCW1303909.1 DUF763 domain-containing protein [Candidatus Haiyanarchaeum thermophilum]MCW1306766.1 DUF763 domain-containing protein [Candidatus Haiyanarchaeum thermophilum]MCW1307430.1 DUF763 domain-containing protein [Candidatus Haiyanarchaeum thermophilum]